MKIRNSMTFSGITDMNTLEDCRREIDAFDEAILAMLALRFRACAAIARYKRDRGIPMLQPARAAAVVLRIRRLASEYGIGADLAEGLYTLIMAESCRLGEEIIAANGSTDRATHAATL